MILKGFSVAKTFLRPESASLIIFTDPAVKTRINLLTHLSMQIFVIIEKLFDVLKLIFLVFF